MKRRSFVRLGAAVPAAAWLPAARAQSLPGWNKAAFDAKALTDALKALGGSGPSVESAEVVLDAPEIAENGAAVRMSLRSGLPQTTQIALYIAKNPHPLIAVFDLPAGTEAAATLNVKMAQTTPVYALARVGDRWFHASRNVQVTIGGCGV